MIFRNLWIFSFLSFSPFLMGMEVEPSLNVLEGVQLTATATMPEDRNIFYRLDPCDPDYNGGKYYKLKAHVPLNITFPCLPKNTSPNNAQSTLKAYNFKHDNEDINFVFAQSSIPLSALKKYDNHKKNLLVQLGLAQVALYFDNERVLGNTEVGVLTKEKYVPWFVCDNDKTVLQHFGPNNVRYVPIALQLGGTEEQSPLEFDDILIQKKQIFAQTPHLEFLTPHNPFLFDKEESENKKIELELIAQDPKIEGPLHNPLKLMQGPQGYRIKDETKKMKQTKHIFNRQLGIK